MAERIRDRLMHAWNAFTDQEKEDRIQPNFGSTFGLRQDRRRSFLSNERNVVSSIYARISIDVAAIAIKHVRLDQNERYKETIPSGLNECLTVEANLDQGARAFRQDIAMSLFDEGVIAIVPVRTDTNPKLTDGYQIQSLRVGEIVSWMPRHVRLRIYNEDTGNKEEVTLPKKMVAIVENPLYSVMNEPNSTLKRLLRKLSLLDLVDEQSGSGKLDLIIQLPYVIKTEARRAEADKRRKDIEMQLKGSQYGIAYTDGTEKITQLNRPAENQLMDQVKTLTAQLYSELGLTPEIFNGTADEQAMVNYHNRTVEPILSAITEAMKRNFLTKTARTQGHSIEFFRDPFKLVPVSDLAEIADKFTRNEILTSNEVRGIIGFKPADDAKADELRNKNLPIVDSITPPI